ncbi:MAG: PadR family transcriptional regulator [Myxococcota bacterium]
MASKELVAASSRPLILAVLRSGESYGYAILKEVRELSDGDLDWADGMLYPVLRRLENEGLVRSRWALSPEGRRRRYYSLTKRGAAEASAGREEWVSVDRTLRKAWRLADQRA